MKLVALIEVVRARSKTVARVGYGVLAALVVLDALPFLVDKEQAHTAAEHVPGFWSGFGWLACVLIIFVSKACGRAGIVKREDYYDE